MNTTTGTDPAEQVAATDREVIDAFNGGLGDPWYDLGSRISKGIAALEAKPQIDTDARLAAKTTGLIAAQTIYDRIDLFSMPIERSGMRSVSGHANLRLRAWLEFGDEIAKAVLKARAEGSEAYASGLALGLSYQTGYGSIDALSAPARKRIVRTAGVV